MGLSDWFTIFGLFLAIYALFSAEERRITLLKLAKYDPIILLTAVVITLVLIKYHEIAERITALQKLYIKSGVDPSNLALILFLATSVYYAYKLGRLPEKFPSHKLVLYYRDIMNQDFKLFFRLFNKYERNARKKSNFKAYEEIIFDPVFLDGVSDQPYYYTDLLDKIDKPTFERYFKSLLNNPESVYYKEVRENDNYYRVQDENHFLYTLIHNKPDMFFDIGGLPILKKWYLNHLEKERIKRAQSIYNQPADQSLDSFEVDMPLYLHVWFINMLYHEAIAERIDTSMLSDQFVNMQSIFSHLIDKAVQNIDKSTYRRYQDEEYPLKYHYLFAQITGIVAKWITIFGKPENYINESSLLSFFPFCLHLCIQSLIRGYEEKVISEKFLITRIHWDVLCTYYKHDLNEELRGELEKSCIAEIHKPLLQSALKYSLNEKFALSYRNFEEGNFNVAGLRSQEKHVIKRLYNFLHEQEFFNDQLD